MNVQPSTIPAVRVANVSKDFVVGRGNTVPALKDVNFDIAPGEFVSLIGPSGCGKSTLLRLIADLEKPTTGSLEIFGQSPSQARVAQAYGIAFQQAGLLPWLTVEDNVRLPLELHNYPKEKQEDRVTQLLDMVGLSDFRGHFPDQLSGGMQQRVAIIRALAEEPRLLLMDEPFGALDEMTREHMQNEMSRIQLENESAVLLVTHSINEAVFLSDTIVVLAARPGRLIEKIHLDFRRRGLDGDELRESPEFFEAMKQVREALRTGSERPSSAKVA